MKKAIRIAFVAVLAVVMAATATSCKKKADPRANELTALAAKVTAAGEKEINKGMTLTKCEYNAQDTVFTLYYQIDDSRFDGVTPDSLKATIAKDIKEEKRQKLTHAIKSRGAAMQYVYNTPSKIISVFFTNAEL